MERVQDIPAFHGQPGPLAAPLTLAFLDVDERMRRQERLGGPGWRLRLLGGRLGLGLRDKLGLRVDGDCDPVFFSKMRRRGDAAAAVGATRIEGNSTKEAGSTNITRRGAN